MICFLVGHNWQPLRFQTTQDPRCWVHQCARCGKAMIGRR